MPRPKSTGNKPLPANQQKGKKVCTCCHEEKKVIDFYLSYSPLYSLDQRVPVCKNCCKTSSLNDDGTINYHKFKNLLMQIDKPLYYDLLESSEESVFNEDGYLDKDALKYRGKEILQKYFTLVVMRQDKKKSWVDAEKERHVHQKSTKNLTEQKRILRKYQPLFEDNYVRKNESIIQTAPINETTILLKDYEDFEVTPEIISLFGEGYTKSDYKKMYKKYEKLKLNYTLQTNLHQEALATYVRFKVKEEDATAKGCVDEAKKWYDAAQNAAANGKLTPKQLSAADLQKGMNSVCELVKAVEQATDIIKIMPQFKYRPIDAVDFTIMCYVNYERKLNGQPCVEYEDIYSFYDKKKEEYIKQNGDPYGIFKNDPTIKNRENVKTFLKMPDDYDELVGDSNENN